MKKISLTFYTIVALLLSACGYHLKGLAALPPEFDNVYMKSKIAYSPNVVLITKTFKRNNVTITKDAINADYIFNVLKESENNNLEGSGTTQETRKYTLISRITFVVTDKHGNSIYGPESVQSTAPLYIYSGQVLGNNQETNNIFKTLRQENAQKVLSMLSSKDALADFAKPLPGPTHENKQRSTQTNA